MTHLLFEMSWASHSLRLWPPLCHTDPNNIATAVDQQQSAEDIYSVSGIFVKQVQGLLVINRFRKTTPSYYSWQSVNNHCFDKPRTLEGIGTVQPLSEWSVCCRTTVE